MKNWGDVRTCAYVNVTRLPVHKCVVRRDESTRGQKRQLPDKKRSGGEGWFEELVLCDILVNAVVNLNSHLYRAIVHEERIVCNYSSYVCGSWLVNVEVRTEALIDRSDSRQREGLPSLPFHCIHGHHRPSTVSVAPLYYYWYSTPIAIAAHVSR